MSWTCHVRQVPFVLLEDTLKPHEIRYLNIVVYVSLLQASGDRSFKALYDCVF